MTMFAPVDYLYLALIDFLHAYALSNYGRMTCFLGQILNSRMTSILGWREYILPLVTFRYKMSYCKMKVDQISEFIFLGSTVPHISFF